MSETNQGETSEMSATKQITHLPLMRAHFKQANLITIQANQSVVCFTPQSMDSTSVA